MAKEHESKENSAQRHPLQYRGVACLNCGHPLDISDRFCSNCSQLNSIKKPSLKEYMLEFFSSVFSYDTKLFKTLAALLLRPGKITRDYIAGKRVSYTNPFRFLLSLAIIYFILVGLGGNVEVDSFAEDDRDGIFKIDSPIITYRDADGNEADKEVLMQLRESQKIKENINIEELKRDATILAHPNEALKAADSASFFPGYLRKVEVLMSLIEKDSLRNFEAATSRYTLPGTAGNKAAFHTAKSMVKAKGQPELVINALISRLPFTTFFFLPVFTIFIWLMYIRKKYTYTDHLIFSFHNQSLLFILLSVSYLIDAIFNTESGGLFVLIFAIYLYKAMRNFYGQGRFKTIVKYSILNMLFIILASIGVILLLAGSIFTY